MFHGRCSTAFRLHGVFGWRGDPPGAGLGRRECRRAELPLGRAAADRATEAELADRCAPPAVAGELLERGHAPAVAVVTVEAEGVPVRDQVGDRVQVDRVHGPSVAPGGLSR